MTRLGVRSAAAIVECASSPPAEWVVSKPAGVSKPCARDERLLRLVEWHQLHAHTALAPVWREAARPRRNENNRGA